MQAQQPLRGQSDNNPSESKSNFSSGLFSIGQAIHLELSPSQKIKKKSDDVPFPGSKLAGNAYRVGVKLSGHRSTCSPLHGA